MTIALLIIGALQTAGICGVVWGVVWGITRQTAVLRALLSEAEASATERERRREAEAAGALFDAQRVREAEFVLAMLDTEPACGQCRELVEAGRQRLRERMKRYPRQPDALKTFPRSTGGTG